MRDQGKEVLALGISMAKGGDIIELGKALKTATDAVRAELPAGIEMRQFQNQSTVVARSVGEFVGVLIEHFAGAFPLWLAPVQVGLVPISEKHLEYATAVKAKLEAAGLRVEPAALCRALVEWTTFARKRYTRPCSVANRLALTRLTAPILP